MKRTASIMLMTVLLWTLGPVQAATRAWLDRNQIALGESATLNIETDQATALPDFSPLRAEFDVSGQGSSRQVLMTNGAMTTRTTHVINVIPRRAGTLSIPALVVGAERSTPLTLAVGESAQGDTNSSNATTFLQTEIDDPNPYVQQSVGVTLRLFYAVPLASGRLDMKAPEGASMQQVGDDVESARMVNGRRYNIVERHFLLVPDRSGPLVIPGARFEGRSAGGWIDDLMGDGRRELRAIGTPSVLEVRAQPANAPHPWLPVRGLRMRYVGAPQSLRAGEAATLVVEVVAQGATQTQMPELPVPTVSGAQVFPEPPQYSESVNAGSPQVKMTRSYSLVPNGAGTLVVPGLKVAWWDVRAGAAKTASLPDLTFKVAPGTGGFADSTLPAATDTKIPGDNAWSGIADPATPETGRYWIWLALAFALLWLATLAWAVQRRAPAPIRRLTLQAGETGESATPTHTLPDLKRALDSGDLEEVGEVLRGMSSPPSADLDALADKLDSPAQREALEQLRRARWAGGDGVAARTALRAAFREGPVWRATPKPAVEILPPLYPRR